MELRYIVSVDQRIIAYKGLWWDTQVTGSQIILHTVYKQCQGVYFILSVLQMILVTKLNMSNYRGQSFLLHNSTSIHQI